MTLTCFEKVSVIIFINLTGWLCQFYMQHLAKLYNKQLTVEKYCIIYIYIYNARGLKKGLATAQAAIGSWLQSKTRG